MLMPPRERKFWANDELISFEWQFVGMAVRLIVGWIESVDFAALVCVSSGRNHSAGHHLKSEFVG